MSLYQVVYTHYGVQMSAGKPTLEEAQLLAGALKHSGCTVSIWEHTDSGKKKVELTDIMSKGKTIPPKLGHDEVAALRREYPEGTAVELIHMDDFQAPPAGTRGSVSLIDDAGQIFVRWDSGSSLPLIPGVDVWKKVAQN